MELSVFLVCLLPLHSIAYESLDELYDAEYQYQDIDNTISQEVQVTTTPVFISRPVHICFNVTASK